MNRKTWIVLMLVAMLAGMLMGCKSETKEPDTTAATQMAETTAATQMTETADPSETEAVEATETVLGMEEPVEETEEEETEEEKTDATETDAEDEPEETETVADEEPNEVIYISYEEYMSLSAEKQQAYYESFPSAAEFFAWLDAAKAAYEATTEPVKETEPDESDGPVEIIDGVIVEEGLEDLG